MVIKFRVGKLLLNMQTAANPLAWITSLVNNFSALLWLLRLLFFCFNFNFAVNKLWHLRDGIEFRNSVKTSTSFCRWRNEGSWVVSLAFLLACSTLGFLWQVRLDTGCLFRLLKDSFVLLNPKMYLLPSLPPYTHTHKSYSYLTEI